MSRKESQFTISRTNGNFVEGRQQYASRKVRGISIENMRVHGSIPTLLTQQHGEEVVRKVEKGFDATVDVQIARRDTRLHISMGYLAVTGIPHGSRIQRQIPLPFARVGFEEITPGQDKAFLTVLAVEVVDVENLNFVPVIAEIPPVAGEYFVAAINPLRPEGAFIVTQGFRLTELPHEAMSNFVYNTGFSYIAGGNKTAGLIAMQNAMSYAQGDVSAYVLGVHQHPQQRSVRNN
jgi:hypothetical protein